MSVYSNTCGKYTLTVSDPWPMWVKISTEHGELPGLCSSSDLYDLLHLVQRAISAVEEWERRWK